MKTVLFVCTGNTCRSPMAEALLRREAGRRGIHVTVSSAGTFAVEGAPASPRAVAAVRRRGADLALHGSRPIDRRALDEADLVIAMSPAHLRVLLDVPGLETKSRLLTDFLPQGDPLRGAGVDDPIGGDDAEYERTARVIERCLPHVLDSLEDF